MPSKGFHYNSEIIRQYQIIVVGGGIAGTCAALAVARCGIKTALVQERSVLGGNASAEIRVRIAGASCGGKLPNAREEGIVGEIIRKAVRHNPEYQEIAVSTVMWEMCIEEKNLSLFLDTCVYDVDLPDEKTIAAVRAVQLGTEKRFYLKAEQFIDASGDGVIAALAGAQYRIGFEAKGEYGELLAPEKENDLTMGASLVFCAEDVGHPVSFNRPPWAYCYPRDSSLPFKLTKVTGPHKGGSRFSWIEYGGNLDAIHANSEIREELLKCLYGVWDHLKNTPGHDMENYQLSWVGMVPGKREGRRFIGDYILTEHDLRKTTEVKDAVAYGGWPIDIHDPEGFKGKGIFAFHGMLDWIYSIPVRCLYSKDMDNLWLAGRTISVSKIAFGSARVMATLGICGEAVGYGAAVGIEKSKTCRKVAQDDFEIIQQRILKNGGYIPWKRNQDPDDMARMARVETSSEAVCELRAEETGLPLVADRGIMFPITENKLATLELLVQNISPTDAIIFAELRSAEYPGDFYQEPILGKAQASVCPGKNRLALNFNCELEPGLYWVNLKASAKIDLMAGFCTLPGVYTCSTKRDDAEQLVPFYQNNYTGTEWISKDQHSSGILDERGGFIAPNPGKRKTWRELDSVWHPGNAREIIKLPCPCFKITPPSKAYSGASVINGINRPELFPDLWCSDPNAALPQTLTLKWDEEKKFNRLYLIFDDDIDAFRPSELPRNAMVKKYSIEYRDNKKWEKIITVDDNKERRKIHQFTPVCASQLKITVFATWGAPSARIYEVRIYLEKY
ncbi:MAG: FAD-dependent oxidoreductase [Victivallaceae bacterium]|nr:FAD-dependent oxidoreductase [Victivallaceae bacterium]